MKTGIYPEDIVGGVRRARAAAPGALGRRAQRGFSRRQRTAATSSATPNSRSTRDGKVLAYRLRSLADVGAYAGTTGIIIQLLIGPWVSTSIYDIRTIDFQFDAVLTHTRAARRLSRRRDVRRRSI